MRKLGRAATIVISLTLSLALALSPLASVPMARAYDTPVSENTLSDTERIAAARPIEKGLDYTIFEEEDGGRILRSYFSPVRYRDEKGELRDYDNSLKPVSEESEYSDEYAFVNAAGDEKAYLPEELSEETPIKVADESGSEFSMSPASEATGKAEVIETKEESLYGREEKKDTTVSYAAEEKGVHFEYKLIDRGVKESVIIEERPGSKKELEKLSSFRFKISKEGCEARLTSEGAVVFYEEESPTPSGIIAPPNVKDSSEKGEVTTGAVSYLLSEEKEGYCVLTLKVSEEYLADEKRVYPVIIDPTYSGSSDSYVNEVYVRKSAPTDHYYGDAFRVLAVGNSSTEGMYRTYVKFGSWKNEIGEDAYIESAKLKVTVQNGGGGGTVRVDAHRTTENKSFSDITWNDSPNYASAVSDYVNAGELWGDHTFTLTEEFRDWKKGAYENYGILLKANTEDSDTYNYKAFFSADTEAVSSRPVLTIEYEKHDPPKAPKVTVDDDETAYLGESDVTLKYSGLASDILDEVEYAVRKYDVNNAGEHVLSDDYVKEYSDSPNLSASKSGSKELTLSEGCYRIYVRGKDKAGQTGSSGYATLHIDKTAPSVSFSASPASSASNWKGEDIEPRLSWSGHFDKHPRDIGLTVAKNGVTPALSAYEYLGDTDASGFENVDMSEYGSGIYRFWLRAYDKIGNAKVLSSSPYYYDETPPSCGNPEVVYEGATKSYKGWTSGKDPSFEIPDTGDSHSGVDESKLFYKISNSAEDEDGGDDSEEPDLSLYTKAAVFSFSEGEAAFRLNEADRGLLSGKYVIQMLVFDKAGNASEPKSIPYYRHCTPMKITIAAIHDEADFNQAPGIYAGENAIVKTYAEDFRISFDISKVSLIDSFGKETKILRQGPIIRTKEGASIKFDTSKIPNGKYILRFSGKDFLDYESSSETEIYIENEIDFPGELSLDSLYVSGPAQFLRWDFRGEKSVNFVRFEYDIVSKGAIAKNGDYRVLENIKDGYRASDYENGEAALSFVPEEDGEHKVILKAIGNSRIPGILREKFAELNFILDRQKPKVNIEAYRDGLVVGEVTDDNLKKWDLYISSKTKGEGSTELLMSGTKEISGGTIAELDLSEYPQGTYTVSVVASDLAGNVSESQRDVLKISLDGASPIKPSIRIAEFYSEVNPVNRKLETGLNLKEVGGFDFPGGEISWFMDGKKVGGNSQTFKDDFEDTEKYKEGEIRSLIAKVSGESGEFFTGEMREAKLFSDDFTAERGAEDEGTFASGGALILEEGRNSGSAVLFEANLSGSLAKFAFDARDLGARYFISLDGGTEKEAVQGKIYDVFDFSGKAVCDSVRIRIELKGAGAKLENFEMSGTFVSQDKFYVTYVELYGAANLKVEKSINYKPVITWEVNDNNALPKDITYEVYKGGEEDFIPSEKTLVAEGLTDFCYRDINANDGETWYKVRARYEPKKGAPEFSEPAKVKNDDAFSLSSITDNVGDVENRGYLDFNTPNANMKTEKSAGNLLYEKTDFTLGSAPFSPSLTRTYNSYANLESEFGKGFDHSFNEALFFVRSGKFGVPSQAVFKDTDGRLFLFPRAMRGGAYALKEPTIMRLTPEALEHNLTFNEGTGGERIPAIQSSYSLKVSESEFLYFNSMGEIVLARDDKENFLVYVRDENTGLLDSVITNAKESLKFSYAKGGDKITRIEMKDESYYSYEYDGGGYMLSQTHGSSPEKGGGIIVYEYGYEKAEKGEYDKLSLVKDAKGSPYEISYEKSKVIKLTYPSSERIELTYGGKKTAIKKSKGLRIISEESSEFDDAGRVTKDTLPNGNFVRYEYVNGLLSKTITREWPVKLKGGREEGEITVSHSPIEKISEIKYDEDGNPIKEEEEEDDTKTTYSYDSQGRVIKEVTITGEAPDRVVTTITYEYIKVAGDGDINGSEEKVKTKTKIGYEPEEIDIEIVDAYGNSVSETDEEDGIITKESALYDDLGNEIREMTVEGEVEQVASGTDNVYDKMNRVLTEESWTKNSSGVRTITSTVYHTYDGFGREIMTLTSYPDKTSEVVYTEYDKNGSVTKTTDKDGISTINVYDCMNKIVLTRTTGHGRDNVTTTTKEYVDIEINTHKGKLLVKSALLTMTINPLGERSLSYQDNMGRQIRNVSSGIVTDNSYSPDGKQIISISFPEKIGIGGAGSLRASANAYDDDGNQTASVQNPELKEEKILIGESSVVTRTDYDGQGNAVKETDANGNATEFSYDKQTKEKPVKITEPSGAVTKLKYEDLLTTTIDAEGRVSHERLDDAGREISVTDHGADDSDESKIETSYEYDEKDRLKKTVYQNGNYETYSYDKKDRQTLVSHKLEGGSLDFKTSYSYDEKDRVTLSEDFDGEGKLTRRTSYAYDVFGNMTRFTEEDIKTGKESSFRYSYDNLDRVISIKYSGEDEIKGASYEYGKYGRLSSVNIILPSGKEKLLRKYSYDDWGRIHEITDLANPLSSDSVKITKEYSYDKLDRAVDLEVTSAGKLTEKYEYSYDKKSQVTKEKIYNKESSVDEVRLFSYDECDRLVRTEIKKKVPEEGTLSLLKERYEKDMHQTRPSKLDEAWNDLYPYLSLAEEGDYITVKEKTYSYDKLGNRTGEEVKSGEDASGTEEGYRYLMLAMGEEKIEEFSKDSSFNEFNQLALTKIASSSKALRMGDVEYEDKVKTIYSYDENGNQTRETVKSAIEKTGVAERLAGGRFKASPIKVGTVLSDIKSSYDSANRLTKTEETTFSEVPITPVVVGEDTLTYEFVKSEKTTKNTHNGEGQRTSKTVSQNGETSPASSVHYFYQDGVVSMTTDEKGVKTSRNILGLSDNVISTKRYGGKYDGELFNYGKDDQGSVTSVYDEEGDFVMGYLYDDFGQTERVDGKITEVYPEKKIKEDNSDFFNEVAYSGGIYDESTELYYLNARYYNPSEGRFTARDTYRGETGEPSSLHLYAYCANNPINFVDPSGHQKYYYGTGTKVPKKAKYGKNTKLFKLKKGDVVFDAKGSFSIAGHMAIVEKVKKNKYVRIIEAVLSGVCRGIVDDTRVKERKESFYRVKSKYLNSAAKKAAKKAGRKVKVSKKDIINGAVNFAYARLGKKYGFDVIDKGSANENDWYCSELVWAAYKSQGINLAKYARKIRPGGRGGEEFTTNGHHCRESSRLPRS